MRVINFVSIDLIGAAKLITVDFKSAKLDTIPESIRGKTHITRANTSEGMETITEASMSFQP